MSRPRLAAPGLLAVGLLAAAAAGGLAAAAPAAAFTGYLAGGLFRPVETGPHLNRPARVTRVRTIFPIFGGFSSLVAVVLNYPGQNLRVESNDLDTGPTEESTLSEVLGNEPEAYDFQFYEVRNIDGKKVGYLLARDEGLEFVALEKGGVLFLTAWDPSEP